MGAGADVAVESAGMTLMTGDLGGIVRARRLAMATMGNIRQNLFFAFVYNALGVPLAAGVLYPGLRHPAVADHRRGSDEPLLRLGDRQRAPAQAGKTLDRAGKNARGPPQSFRVHATPQGLLFD